MTTPCSLLDRYRDKDLPVPERVEFESHLSHCDSCRETSGLLNNVARLVSGIEVPLHPAFAARTASIAFAQSKRWDIVLVSLLRPAGAWLSFVLLLLISSAVLLSPLMRDSEPDSELEAMLADNETAPRNIQSDEDLLHWLQQEAH